MIYRRMDSNNDMTFGSGQANYLANSPACVAQAVATRLRLWLGEWFLDVTDGTPYNPAILGKHTKASYDFAVRRRVLQTEGVTAIDEYDSVYDGETRHLTVSLTISTVYGQASLREIL